MEAPFCEREQMGMTEKDEPEIRKIKGPKR
jgi:hypothetical protein